MKSLQKKIFFLLIVFANVLLAQNSKIKCYFNHPVNTNVSMGTDAVYLNSTFPDTIAAYINRAKHTVDIAQYDYTSFSTSHVKVIATAVNNAHTRGVVVRWIYNGSSSNTGLSLLNSAIHTLGSPTTSTYGIMHNKFVVIDANSSTPSDAYVLTMSYDWSDQQTTSDYNNMIIFQDQTLAQAYQTQFNQMWGGTGSAPGTNSAFGTHKTISSNMSFTVNGTPVQVYFSPKDGAQTALLNCVNSASTDLYFGIYTFTDNTVANAFKTQYTTNGINGFGIEDSYSTGTCCNGPYNLLSPSNVMGNHLKIYNGGSNSIYHNKMVLADALNPASDPQVGTGSYNWTSSATNKNDENFIVIHDATIANQYYQSLCMDFATMGGASCPSLSTGIPAFDFGHQQYAVYPNPFNDEIKISVKRTIDFKVEVFNILGEKLLDNSFIASDNVSMSTSELSSGIYIVKITNANDSYVQRIIKR